MDMIKIVYNNCYGGAGLSQKALKRYAELKGIPVPQYDWEPLDDRADPILAQLVEELGEDAGRSCSELMIREIPKGTKYRIDEYDGLERVMTIDDYNWNIA